MKKKFRNNDNDIKLLELAFQNVTPLSGKKITKISLDPIPQTRKNSSYKPPPPAKIKTKPNTPVFQKIDIGNSSNLDKRSAKRLKQGKLIIEGRLDLHGLKQVEAHERLIDFLRDAYQKDKRCVLIITGKGRLLEGGGVLKKNVPHWLNSPKIREIILSCNHARPADGGTGALYVLLKRKRI